MPLESIPAWVPTARTALYSTGLGFTIGNNAEGELPQVGNSFQWSDSISKVIGTHSFKFGGDVRRQRFDQTLYFNVSGEFFVDGSSSNSTLGDSVFSDYLLGFPGSYGQGSAQVENVRSTGIYLFAQDSWKIRPNLTLNYGLRWEFNSPLTDIGHHVQTFRPGQNSKIYPCQLSQASIDALGTSDCTSVEPTGLVVPGDPGVPNGLTQTYYKSIRSTHRPCVESGNVRQDKRPWRVGPVL